jgi:hypothetical protein
LRGMSAHRITTTFNFSLVSPTTRLRYDCKTMWEYLGISSDCINFLISEEASCPLSNGLLYNPPKGDINTIDLTLPILFLLHRPYISLNYVCLRYKSVHAQSTLGYFFKLWKMYR